MIPKTLNLGSGKDFRQECLNIDKDREWMPDIACDMGINLRLEELKIYSTKRFGQMRLKRRMFERIIAIDVLEHITDLKTCMTNCLGLLETGGVMEIIVPYDLGLGAWQDPTHVRAFNQNSWIYYTEWSWYLGWKEEKFSLTKLEFGMGELGKRMEAQGMSLKDIINVSRAVDKMRVELKKIITQDTVKGGHNG